jgi:iron complex outermembrane recepter protein
MKKTLLLLMIFAFFSLNAELNAQTVVTGKVTEANTGDPLPGATVAVDGTTNATVSGPDGTFKLNVSAGDIAINISYIGFLTEQVKLSIAAGETKDLETIKLQSDDIGMDELLIVASYAKDRETPVSVSTIKPEMIMEKLGTQEFPEILKSTPSVYATKEGGGYGDGRINLRGFDSNNIGVLINGVPVNDMENGRVYWSNWAGLSDVTRTMQVQRGLGASKLAISSIGGTINIITKSTDAKKGGSIYYGMGNNGYNKTGFTLSTGMYENGWAVTVSGSKTKGNGYVDGTDFEAWSYFVNVAKRLTDNQQISFTAFGAPQWHHQRGSQQLVQTYREHPSGIRYNSGMGYRHGDVYNTGYGYNKYHKPQLSLNHTWDISPATKWTTALYASKSQGGGRRVRGPQSDLLSLDYPEGKPLEETLLTPEGYIDYDAAMQINAESQTGSQAVMSMSTNAHDWYGILSSFNTEVNNINITAGVDGRYYRGYHYREITDLLGGEYYLDANNVNRDPSTPLYVGDKFSYYSLTDVMWQGLFLQAEYVKDDISAFISAAGSNTGYKRTDYFQYEPGNQATDWVSFLGYSTKAGFNYNFTKRQNVFVNGGYFTRAPFANAVFMNHTNEINEDAKPQRVLSAELGYGYRSSFMRADIALYRTEWLDKTITRSLGGQETANITGLNALHQGVELQAEFYPIDKMDIKLMGSMGDWRWQDDVQAALFDQDQNLVDSINVFAAGIHVGDAAQTTAAVGINYEILPDLKFGFDYNYYDRLFADYDIEDRTKPELSGVDAWRVPDYHLFDFNIRYYFKLGDFKSSLNANINNIFDTEYIADATDQTKLIGNEIQYGDATNSPVYFGFGRTWSISLKINF